MYNIYIYICIYMVLTIEGLFEVALESWPEWDLKPRPLKEIYLKEIGLSFFNKIL